MAQKGVPKRTCQNKSRNTQIKTTASKYSVEKVFFFCKLYNEGSQIDRPTIQYNIDDICRHFSFFFFLPTHMHVRVWKKGKQKKKVPKKMTSSRRLAGRYSVVYQC